MILILLNTGMAQTTYYVDAVNGNDSYTGTSALTAWKTLTKVSSTTFQAGDSILFKSACSWTGQLKPKGSGNSTKSIIIEMYGGIVKPLINGNGVIGQATLYLNNQQYWEINNLEITNDAATAGDRRGVLIAASDFGIVHHIYLKNLDIHNVKGIVGQDLEAKRTAGIGIETTSDSIIATRYDDILISGCNIYSIENTGIYTENRVVGNDYPQSSAWLNRRFTNVQITNNTIHHISKNAMIIRLFDKGVIEHNVCYETSNGVDMTGNTMFTAACDSTVFQYNEGYNNRSVGADGSMYDADLRSPRTIWQYSYSHDNAHGLFWTCTVQADSGVICRYNISQNDKGIIFCINYPNTSVYCYNNSVYIGPALSPIIISERNMNSGTRKYYFLNNIIYNLSSTATYDFRTSGYTRIIDYNVFYGNHPSNEPADAHKLTSDPLFVNPGSGTIGIGTVDGYRIQTSSPCINSGLTIANNGGKDFWGNSVPFGGSVDRGAYENSVILPQYELNLNYLHGTVTKEPDYAQFDSNSTVQITAIADLGYHFVNWSGDLTGTSNPASVIMDSDKNITANFSQNTSNTFIVWNGTAGDGQWSTPSNWSSNTVPARTDTVVLDRSVVIDTFSVNVTQAGSVCRKLIIRDGVKLKITGSLATLTVGDSITGNNDVVIENNGELQNLSTIATGSGLNLLNNTIDKFRIDDGGKYYHNSPRGFSTPFPVTACDFAPNSTVEYAELSSAQPPMANRVYGNLIFSSSIRKSLTVSSSTSGLTINGTLSILGDSLSFIAKWTSANTITINDIYHDGDTLSFTSSTSPITIRNITNNHLITATTASSSILLTGNIVNNAVISLGSAQTVHFQGSMMQTISGIGTINFSGGMKVNNESGISSSTDINILADSLVFIAGNITMTNSASFNLGPDVILSRASGHVVGKLEKYISSTDTSVVFEIGDNSHYTPVTISFDSIMTAGRLTGSVTPGMFSEISSSGLNVSKKLNRYYTITNDGLIFSDYSATFTYDSGDIDVGASPDSFIVKQYNGISWVAPALNGITDTSISITGVAAFSDFIIGELAPLSSFAVVVNSTHGSILVNPEKPLYTYGEIVSFTAVPDFGYHFSLWGDDLSGNANPDSLIITTETIVTANFEPTVLTQRFRSGWNLVSVPATVADYSKNVLYPSAVSDAYSYDGSYISNDTLVNMKGYWLKFAKDESVSVSCDFKLQDSIEIDEGWNIIGTISIPVTTTEVRQSTSGLLISAFFAYTTTYEEVDTLIPGYAYWVKASRSGRIYLGTPGRKL